MSLCFFVLVVFCNIFALRATFDTLPTYMQASPEVGRVRRVEGE